MPENFEVTLGGRSWQLPRLPFRVVKQVQPELLRLAHEIAEGEDAAIVGRLTERVLSEQARLVAVALHEVDPEITAETLGEMIFDLGDLGNAIVAVLGACGLQGKPASAGGVG